MLVHQLNRNNAQTLIPVPTPKATCFQPFSDGDAGYAHVTAHRMLDLGQISLGHRLLGEWLTNRSDAGSQWIHLQWHMAVFELALGHWRAAYRRFHAHILPEAISSENALTDAPALLWRLALSTDSAPVLAWQPIRATALRRLQRPADPYVELHCLLALAGADDIASLDQWLHNNGKRSTTDPQRLVVQMAAAFRAYTGGQYDEAGAILAETVPFMAIVGGSRAQNQLFKQLEQACHRHATGNEGLAPITKAA